jgi:hypothetical protein
LPRQPIIWKSFSFSSGLAKHNDLKDKDLVDAVEREDWDPSIQAMAALPDVVKRLADNIKWTSELGNAFLAQQSDVMDAVQRMRMKAKDGGKLKSSEQMKVETKVVESKSVVMIEQANPQVIHVPNYDPVVVWGAAPVYAYPPGRNGHGRDVERGWGWNCDGVVTTPLTLTTTISTATVTSTERMSGAGTATGNIIRSTAAEPHTGTKANKFGGAARGESMGS